MNRVPTKSRWPAGNPETGYLDTDGSPTKSLILDLGRADRSDRFWSWNFGMRPSLELYDLRSDRDCCVNLAGSANNADQVNSLVLKMEDELKAQEDPRMSGNGAIFDNYEPTNGAGFYEKYMKGQKVNAGWVEKTDFETAPLSGLLN